jgi:hypothetical protein
LTEREQNSASGLPAQNVRSQRRFPALRFRQKKWSVSDETLTVKQPSYLILLNMIGKPENH